MYAHKGGKILKKKKGIWEWEVIIRKTNRRIDNVPFLDLVVMTVLFSNSLNHLSVLETFPEVCYVSY